jgi:alanyl-tRNA synthetase
MNANKIRKLFLNYFTQHGHAQIPSSPLVPEGDQTLLFTNAGMVQFKNIFTGQEKPASKSATSVQLCLRAGGKHNDLDNVGYTARHHTLFEMLGNFSFGAYFKHDAIGYAWEFLTEVLQIPKEKLWVTIHNDDKDSASIWLNEINIKRDRIIRLGDESNFWSMGDTGPCGPCTEIFYDHGDSVSGGPPGSPDEDGDRFVEIWNIVFMQFNRSSDGQVTTLPKPCVDTGMGLERITAVMQSVHDNYEIDLFQKLINEIRSLSHATDKSADVSMRVIADHIRSITFLISQGIVPGNEGRAYVLRRIIRRAARHGVKLGLREPFLYKLLPALIRLMSDQYPALKEKQDYIKRTLIAEEKQFAKTLTRGLRIFDTQLKSIEGDKIPGQLIFLLYDTYGFPPDMTADIARERCLEMDYAGFDAAMRQQREQSKQFQTFSVDYTKQLHIPGETEFIGYESASADCKITNLFHDGLPAPVLEKGQEGVIVLDRTPFYAEAGGQVGDKGRLYSSGSRFEVTDTKKHGPIIMHSGRVIEGRFSVDNSITAEVDSQRSKTMANHTATHLLHAALRRSLGDHVQQKGSLVAPERLRFDFMHASPLTLNQIHAVELMVNQQIIANLPVEVKIMTAQEVAEQNVTALFDNKYGDELRVLKIGDFSIEACGGMHVGHSGEIGFCKIIKEEASASGVRRIEALTGAAAVQWVAQMESNLSSTAKALGASADDIGAKITQLNNDIKQKDKQINSYRQRLAKHQVTNMLNSAPRVAGVSCVISELSSGDAGELRGLIDSFKAQEPRCIVLLVLRSNNSDKINVAAGVSKDLVSIVSARDLLNNLLASLGGKGGGRADFAQGGAQIGASNLHNELEKTRNWLHAMLEAGE